MPPRKSKTPAGRKKGATQTAGGSAIGKQPKSKRSSAAGAASSSGVGGVAAADDLQLGQYTDDELTSKIASQQAQLESLQAAGHRNRPDAQQLDAQLRAMKAELQRRREAAAESFPLRDKDDGGGGGDDDDDGDALRDLPVLLVCDDQRDAHTWAEMEEEMRKIQNAQMERKAFLGKRPAWRKIKLYDVATDLMNQFLGRWKRDNPNRGNPPDDVKARAADAAARVVYPGPYVANLPEYKCMARGLTREERLERANTRELINDVRLKNDGTHRELDTELRDDREILALAELIGAPTTLPGLAEEYVDFMNEERRDIIGTIRRARLRLHHEPTAADLEEQEAIDQWELYEPLFQDETPPPVGAARTSTEDTHSASGQVVVVDGRIRCLGTPRVDWGSDDAKDPAAEAAAGDDREVETREDEATEWVNTRIQETPQEAKKNEKKGKGKAKAPLNPNFQGFDVKVNPLANQNGCRPCKEWKLYIEKEVVDAGGKTRKLRYMAPGTYYQAMKRVLQVRNEINMSQDGGRATPDFEKYDLAFDEDPFYNTGALDALFYQKMGKKWYDDHRWARPEILFKSELLRCFPVPKEATDLSLNKILDFLCWYYVNVVLKGKAMHLETKAQGAPVTSAEQHQQDLLYRLLCCPNCRGKDPFQDEGKEGELYAKIRRLVHERVQQINTYFTLLIEALNDDVLNQPDNAKSFLFNFKAASDPQTNAIVRDEVYKRWLDMNPPHR